MLRAAVSTTCSRVFLPAFRGVPRRTITLGSTGFPKDLLFHPDFFSDAEQQVLLSAALRKLDSTESRQSRRREKEYLANNRDTHPSGLLQETFLPDAYYDFEEGHYDGVIKHFREMHVSSWPVGDIPALEPLLERLRSVHPDEPTQTHILHLAANGEILPHIDNIEASGSWILGVSLGATRTMRLQNMENAEDVFDFSLLPGSVYLQRDSVRYGYKHSILRGGCGQRLSIMIRNHL